MILRLLAGFIAGKRAEAAFLARRTAFLVAAAAFGLIGIVFVTMALWIVVAEFAGALAAWTIFGLIYLAIGFWLFRTARRLEAKAGPQVAAGVAAGAAGPAALATEQAAMQQELNAETGGGAASEQMTGLKAAVPVVAEAFLVGLLTTVFDRGRK